MNTALVPTSTEIVLHDPLFASFRHMVFGWLIEYRPTTRKAYASDIKAWQRFADDLGVPVWPMERPFLAAWRDAMETNGLASKTVARRLTAASSLCKYAEERGIIDRNPAAAVRRPVGQRDESRLVALSEVEVGQIFEAAARSPGPWVPAAIELMLGNALRISEVLDLKWSDLHDFDGMPALAVTGKGNKTRRLPVTPELAAVLDGLDRSTDLIFDGATHWKVSNEVHKIGKQLGIERLHPHALRAGAATSYLRAGGSIYAAQKWLGHADPRTTELYDRSTEDIGSGHPAFVLAATRHGRHEVGAPT
jgi:integrase/recombinase XerD